MTALCLSALLSSAAPPANQVLHTLHALRTAKPNAGSAAGALDQAFPTLVSLHRASEGPVTEQRDGPARAPSDLLRRTEGRIAMVRGHIATLTTAIATLEQQQAQKLVAADAIRAQLGMRKDELGRWHRVAGGVAAVAALRGSGLAGLFAGALVQRQIATREATLTNELNRLDAERIAIGRNIDAHGQMKTSHEGKLTQLQSAESRLVENLRALAATPQATEAPTLAVAVRRVEHATSLLGNLHRQSTLYGEIHDSARGIGHALDAHLGQLGAELTLADQMVRDSFQEVLSLVKVATSRNPEVAARKLLRDQTVKQVTDLLVQAGVSNREIAKLIADRVFPADSERSDRLSAALTKELGAEGSTSVDLPD